MNEQSALPIVQSQQEREEGLLVAHGLQRNWTTLEEVASQFVNWAEMWRLLQAWCSFFIRVTSDTLPPEFPSVVWHCGTSASTFNQGLRLCWHRIDLYGDGISRCPMVTAEVDPRIHDGGGSSQASVISRKILQHSTMARQGAVGNGYESSVPG